MNFNFELNLKVSAFYLEKQKSFIPKKKFFKPLSIHYEPEWKFWLGFWLGGNTTLIHDFCIPLDFLGIKDLKKNKKRPKKFSKAIAKATATFIEIL